jgi:ATP-binding cassette subfamily B protein
MGIGEIAIDFTRLGELILFLIALYALCSLLMYFQERLMADVSQKLTLSLRQIVGEKLAHVPLKFYDRHKKGEILSRVTNDLERLNEILSDGIMRLFTSVILIFGVLILMFRINWILTLIAIGSIFIGLIITGVMSVKSNEYFTARQRSMGKFNARIEENFSGQVEIKTFNLETKFAKETDDAIEELRRDDKKAQFIMFAIMPIIRLFNHIGYVVIAAVGATFVITGRISVGQIIAIFRYVQMSAEPMTEGAFVLNSFQSAIASAERVFVLIDKEEEVKTERIPARLERPHGDISFEHVQFGYGEELLMNDVNFRVKAGQKVAIVGATGAGKTTLVNLIMRFYEVGGGAIKVDGVDVRDFNRKYLRSSLEWCYKILGYLTARLQTTLPMEDPGRSAKRLSTPLKLPEQITSFGHYQMVTILG